MAEQHDDHHRRQREEDSPSPAAPPFKLARHHYSDSQTAGAVTTAVSSPLLKLGLGLGDTTATATVKAPTPVLTFMQMQELQHQTLIYKYMSAGVPVPSNLVLPIWKAVAASAAAALHRFPTLMRWGMECMMDVEPEPGRCRRTDGKKWRCSRDIVPDHKYCERHVHRGRTRSRKPVEELAAPPPTPVVELEPPSNGINMSISLPNVGGFRKYTKTSSSSAGGGGNASSPTRVGFSPSSVLRGGEVAAGKAG